MVSGADCKETLQKCKGKIYFWYITEEMNLPPAPIRIAEGLTGPKGYGLKHIVEDVAGNFTEIKEGRKGSFLPYLKRASIGKL